jgi:hypothetical protein
MQAGPFGYYKHVKTPGGWYHKTRPISLTLIVDNFGVKYVGQEDINHLIGAIKSTYTLTKDWTGNLYCSIALDWDYKNRTVNILMPGYISKKLLEYNHVKTSQRILALTHLPQYGTKAQVPIPPNQSPHLDEKEIRWVQHWQYFVLRSSSQPNGTHGVKHNRGGINCCNRHTMEKCTQLSDYLSDHTDAQIQFYASSMIMNIHSDASYLLEANAWSRVCGHFFMGWMPEDDEPIRLNGTFYVSNVSTNIIRFVVALVEEADLGALYHNCQMGIMY